MKTRNISDSGTFSNSGPFGPFVIGSILFSALFLLIFPLTGNRAIALDAQRVFNNDKYEQIRRTVLDSPATAENMRERYPILMKWAKLLMEKGIDVDSVVPREKAKRIRDLAEQGDTEKACAELDRAFAGLNELTLKSMNKSESAGASRKLIAPRRVSFQTSASKARMINALPDKSTGAEINGKAVFNTFSAPVKDGKFEIALTDQPVWIIEGDLPDTKGLKPQDSPFGFHPAAVSVSRTDQDYAFARDIGVKWDRGGQYLMWVLAQPDLSRAWRWDFYDRYFENLPKGMRTLKNITVAHDGMVQVQGRPKFPGMGNRPKVDLSQYLEGTTYRPKDREAYSAWVRAAVERYDGDGVDDMPGLTTPAKHWQVDNEPPRMREGYADLVLITGKAVKEADPEAKVVMGGLQLPCGEKRKIENYYRTQAPLLRELNGRAVDIVDYHWFGSVGEWKMLPDAMKIVRDDLKKYGFANASIWFTEMGTYSGRPSSRAFGNHPLQTERDQACEMVKRYTVALSEGVEKLFWAWGMKEGFKDIRDNDFFDNTGFIYDGIGPDDPGAGVRKIIYHAHRKMARILKRWNGQAPERLKTSENVYAYRFCFQGCQDRGIIVAWVDE